jgi:hypothetical protein
VKTKKLIGSLLMFAILYNCNLVNAQGEIMETQVSATLESVLILNINPDVNVEFGIIEISENLYQITRKPDDIHFSVESTANWNLSISAGDNYFTCVDDSSCKIPIDFVGYQIENKGTNWDNGLFSHIANRTKDTTMSLSTKKTVVLVNGNKNNIGGAEQNAFVLRWKLNFDDDLLKIDKFYKYKIKEGYYRADFFITLTENNR